MRIFRDENYKLLGINFPEINELFIIENDTVKESETISPTGYKDVVEKACYIENVNIDFDIIKNLYNGRLVISPIDISSKPRKFIVFYLRGRCFKIKVESESEVHYD